MILIIKHISIEGPGTIADFFEKRQVPLDIIELGDGESLPRDMNDIDAVIVLGGPMNVYEEDKCPFLKPEDQFLKEVIKEEIPLLGICLGSQLIAKASGAEVKKAPVKEIGWSMVQMKDEGQFDPLFEGIDDFLAVFQWHHDTFDLPLGAKLLSTSKECPHQAFKLGKNIYGLQFHIEVTKPIIESWIKKYFKVEDANSHPQGKKMLDQYDQIKDRFDQQAGQIYQNFLKIIKENQSTKQVS